MSTIFFIGQNPATGNQTLYSVTSGTLGSIMDSFNPDKDIVEQIWQKRYVFLSATYLDSMKEHAREITDSSVVPRATVDTSLTKCKNINTGDEKIRFLRSGVSQYKRYGDISLLLKIEECEPEFTINDHSEKVQLRPSAQHIQELFKTDGDINVYKAGDVSTTTGGNIVAWVVGSYNGHSIITLEDSPDAQKYVLVSNDVIVGYVSEVPDGFYANAVPVNAQLTVGDTQKHCLVNGNENVTILDAHTTHEVSRQWKNYLELSLSNDGGTVIVTIDGCHVDYNVYPSKPLQYIELTQRVEIEGALSSIGSRWKVESMDVNGIVPEINIFTPDVKETITNYDAFIFVNDNPCIALQNTTVTVTQAVMLRPSFSLENNEGRTFGKLSVGSVYPADMVVYDKSGRAWFHITSDTPISLEESAGVSTRRGWVNGRASDGNYIFSEIEPTVVDGHNVRVKECVYITVKQDLGLVEEELTGNAYAMLQVSALTVEDEEPYVLEYGDKVQLVRKNVDTFQFTHNGTLCKCPIDMLGVSIRLEFIPDFGTFVADSDNMLQFNGSYLCSLRGESLIPVVAFVVDDYVSSTDDAIIDNDHAITGDHVFKIMGQCVHGSYRYVKLLEGDEEEGVTYIARYVDVIIPTMYALAEGDKVKNFTPNDISLKRTPFPGASEAEVIPAGSTVDLTNSFGVLFESRWGIGIDSGKFTNETLYEKVTSQVGIDCKILGSSITYKQCVPYLDGDVSTTWTSTDSVTVQITQEGLLSGEEGTLYCETVESKRWIIDDDGALCFWGSNWGSNDERKSARIPVQNEIYFNAGGGNYAYIVMEGTVPAHLHWNESEINVPVNSVFTALNVWNRVIQGVQNIHTNVYQPSETLFEHVSPDGGRYLVRRTNDYMNVISYEGNYGPDHGVMVRMYRFADETGNDEYRFVEEELGSNALKVIEGQGGSDTHTVCSYFVKTVTACGSDGVLPIDTYGTKEVTVGTVPNFVKKLRISIHSPSFASESVYYISDDGYAYPEEILEATEELSFIRFSEPKYVWVTKDPTVVSEHENPSLTSGTPSPIKIRQSSSLEGLSSAQQEERDPHGFFLKLLGSSSNNLQGEDTILLAEIEGNEVYISIVEDVNLQPSTDNIYVVEVANENLRAVFIGNPDDTSTVAGIDSTDGDIAESDAFDYYTPVFHPGDIVTFTKSCVCAGGVIHLSVNEDTGVIHSVNVSRIASQFSVINEIYQGSSLPQFYLKDKAAALAPMTYMFNGETLEESELSSVSPDTVMLKNLDNPNCVYIAPSVVTDAYRSARVSLKQTMVLDGTGGVNVLAYSFVIPNTRLTPKYMVSHSGSRYYGFEVGISSQGDVLGNVIIWALEECLEPVHSVTFEDCDLQVFTRYQQVQLYSDYSTSASYETLNISVSDLDSAFTEFHVDKAVKQDGEIVFYRIAQNSGIYSGLYLRKGFVRIAEPIVHNVQLFHKANTPFVSPLLYDIGNPVIAHSLYMVPSRKLVDDSDPSDIHTYYEVTVVLSATQTHAAWIKDDNCIIVQVPSEAVSINDETVTVHANAKAYLWDMSDAPVLHVFEEDTTFEDFSVVSDEDGFRYICIEMARSEMNNADSHISVDDPTTPDVNESTEALRVFVPAADVTRNPQGSSNTFLDVADFNVYLGTQRVSIPLSKADGSGDSLSSDEEAALLEYLDSRQNIAHIDAAYVDENDSVVMYRIASESSPVEYYACINVKELEEYWIMNRIVVPLTGQDAVVVDSQEDEGESVGDILTVLWKFTTTEEDAEFLNCGVAVPVDDEHGSEEIVRIVEV